MRTIAHDPEIIVFSNDPLDQPVVDLNVDVEVHDANGRWSASFFTLTNVETLMRTWATSGECGAGLYAWAADMILVKHLSDEVISETVRHLRKAGEFTSAFALLEAD